MTIRAVRYVNEKPVVSHIGFMTDILMEIYCYFPSCETVYRLDYTATETNIDTAMQRKEATGKVNRTIPITRT